MALTLVHNTVTVPNAPPPDAPLSQDLIQGLIAAAQNGTAHTIFGATTGDLLMAVSPMVLGTITAPATGQVLISNGVGVAPSWSAAPAITSPTIASPVFSGTAIGTYTLGGTPSITAPTITGIATVATVAASAGITSSSVSAGIGYATGAGGAVTQTTSRTTGVTLNTITGQITMVSAAGSAAAASFVVSNTSVGATDVILLNVASATNLYELFVTAVAANSFTITFFTTGGIAIDAPVINFAIMKAVNA